MADAAERTSARTDTQLEGYFSEINWRQPARVRINRKPNLKDYRYFFACKLCLYRLGIYRDGHPNPMLPLFGTPGAVESHLAGFHPNPVAHHPSSALAPAISPAHPA